MWRKIPAIMALAALLASAAIAEDTDREKLLNLYNWADYFAPDTLRNFTRLTGIKIQYDTFASDNELMAKLMAGNPGYDIAVPSTMFYPRGIRAGLFQKLDSRSLANWGNLDPKTLSMIAGSGVDPGNLYAMPYIVGYTGFIYNEALVRQRLPDAPVNSLRLLFDPAIAGKIAGCGINYVDSPEDVVQLALIYLGKSPNSQSPADIAAAFDVLRKVRDTVRTIDSSNYLNALAAGDICVSVGWVGNDRQAERQAVESGHRQTLHFVIPAEGAPEFIDTMVILADAPHPKNARLFLNYILEAKVSADIINGLGYPMANRAAMPLVSPEIAGNPTIFPDAETQKRITLQTERTAQANQAVSSGWVSYKAGH